ncbi:MAG: tRNA (adenosine(37)-N6)-threonylcarbamoyltransferase complex ATPase subunit type 1 TsaE [Paenibacillaceae bacterium]
MSKQTVYRFQANGTADTVKLAEHLSPFLDEGGLIALDGDLGAGKTTFSQAIARGLGVNDTVNSPTFTIIKEYQGRLLPFYHMDVYRITELEAEELGLDEYFFGEGVTIVEWANRIEALMPQERLSIYIENLGPEERSFLIVPSGEKYQNWCQALKENYIIL